MISEKNQLKTLQKSVLIGSMLGDGNLNLPRGGLNARLLIKRKLEDREYLQWEYKIFEEFCIQKPRTSYSFDKRTDKTYGSIYFYTKHLNIFTFYHSMWYKDKKIVPKNLELDSYAILIWFLDDGCVISSKNGFLDLKLSTNGFVKEDTEYLSDLLYKRYDASFSVNSEGAIIAADAATRKFLREIDPICPDFMSRKSDKWRLSTNIYDLNIKSFKSRKLESVINYNEFILSVLDKGTNTFSTRDIAEDCKLFCIKNGKLKYYHDIIMGYLLNLVNDGAISMTSFGGRRPKLFNIIDKNILLSLLEI